MRDKKNDSGYFPGHIAPGFLLLKKIVIFVNSNGKI